VLALRLQPGGELVLGDEPQPDPGAGEVLVRVTAVGLCGSDRHWLVDGRIGDTAIVSPLVLGHEFAGVVESGPQRGRRVAVDPSIPCGRCEPCRTGATHLCLAMRFAGHPPTDGALREYVAWPEAGVHPLPDAIDDVEGALVEPLAVALHAVDRAGTLVGASVGVIGCGPIGLLIVAAARAAGAATIVAAEPLAHRREAAAAMGASTVVTATTAGDEREVILGATGGRGLDVVFEAAGEAAAVDTAVEIARPGAEVVMVGIPASDETAFRASVARRKELTIRFSRRSSEASMSRAIDLAASGAIDLAGLVSLCVGLPDAARAFEALVARSEIKVIVRPRWAA
jgi:L-iditol 2-dehydrogenase